MGVQTSGGQGVPSAVFQHVAEIYTLYPRQLFRTAGQWAVFIAQTVYLLPLTVRKYRRETLDRMNDLAWGRGSLIVDGGVISVLVILGIAIGGMVAIEAWATLNMMGLGALTGIVGGLANVREMAPLVAGIAFAAHVRMPHDG